ncbi:glycosyltransferase family 2 protein [Rhodocista pekingensis]|uniref:Glycosyltransferase family 2 protein n=1 Tax=Rhodocista pekingensis TaxID=201185 RepID=A0ABW2KVU5_9PROT
MTGFPLPLTVIVMVRNERANLPGCLASLEGMAEIVVADSGSDDGSADIARAAGARVVPFVWNGAYPKKKQWCLDLPDLAHDWVLFVDADERLTPALRDELRRLFAAPPAAAAYFLDSRPVVLGRVLRFGARYRKIALMHRRRVRFPPCDDLAVAAMWEVEGHYQPQVEGAVGRLRAPLLHADAKPPFAWVERHNRYSDWEAWLDAGTGRAAILGTEGRARQRLKRLFAALPGRPLAVFLYEYGVRLGFLDGRAGLHHALGRAFYYWLIAYKRDWIAAERSTGRDADPGRLR